MLYTCTQHKQLARSTDAVAFTGKYMNTKQQVKTSGIAPRGTPQRMTERPPHAHVLVFAAVFPVHKVDGRLHFVAVERLPQVLQRSSNAYTELTRRQKHARESSHLLDALPLLFQTCKSERCYICQIKIISQETHSTAQRWRTPAPVSEA